MTLELERPGSDDGGVATVVRSRKALPLRPTGKLPPVIGPDLGRAQASHYVISERVGFHGVGFHDAHIREFSFGRLLSVHDAVKLEAMFVEVQRNKP